MLRRIAFAVVVLAVIYSAFLGMTYRAMTQPPEEFGRYMKSLPPFAMYAMPFPPMWNWARAGTLAVGDMAPDFELPKHDKSGHVRLSDFRGKRPVVLMFGSYT